MESRKIVLKETAVVAAGVAVCSCVMIGIFALLGRFELNVALGAAVGSLLSVANFFFMAVTASLAADRAESGNVAAGEKLIKGSYPIRLLVLSLILFACAKSGYFNLISLVLPMAFVRPSITIAEFFRK